MYCFILLQQILRHSRGNATKAIFLITDGYSNGGDPRPIAASLRELGVEIFTFGIWQGNIRELNDMASYPKEEHCYLLHSFAEFEALARRALHEGMASCHNDSIISGSIQSMGCKWENLSRGTAQVSWNDLHRFFPLSLFCHIAYVQQKQTYLRY